MNFTVENDLIPTTVAELYDANRASRDYGQIIQDLYRIVHKLSDENRKLKLSVNEQQEIIESEVKFLKMIRDKKRKCQCRKSFLALLSNFSFGLFYAWWSKSFCFNDQFWLYSTKTGKNSTISLKLQRWVATSVQYFHHFHAIWSLLTFWKGSLVELFKTLH